MSSNPTQGQTQGFDLYIDPDIDHFDVDDGTQLQVNKFGEKPFSSHG